ncbi:hypothetical protein LCGC14_0461830 [marine sediment metagenome]|uniref:Uncharacterized protein n=1 Tax=marine sediment metagenome TaxID=412755 RepID=A0A0F9SEZ7_9ZZZZ
MAGRKKDTEKRTRCLELYKKLGNLTLVAKELGVDRSQLGRWAKEEGWDRHLAVLKDEVSRKLKLGALQQAVDVDVHSDELVDNMKRFRFLVTKAMEDFVDQEMEFTQIEQVMKILALWDDKLRLHLGEPTANIRTDHNIVLHGLPANRKIAITTLLEIAQSSPHYEQGGPVIDVTPEPEALPPGEE